MSLVQKHLRPRSHVYSSSNSETLVVQSATNDSRISLINATTASTYTRFVMSASNTYLKIYSEQYSSNVADGSVSSTVTPFLTYQADENSLPTVQTFGKSITSNLQFFPLSGSAQRKMIAMSNHNKASDYEFAGFGMDATGRSLIYQTPYSDSSHIFYTGTSSSTTAELMRIKYDALTQKGQLAIGTNNVSGVTLSIGGNASISGSLTINGLDLSSNYVRVNPDTQRISCNVLPTGVVFASANNNTIDTSLLPTNFSASPYFRTNKFGIGTRTPVQQLHVKGSTAITDRLGIGSIYPSNRLQVVESAAVITTAVLCNIAGGDVLNTYISSNGSPLLPVLTVVGTHQGVGIGTSAVNRGNALQVVGNIQSDSLASSNLIVKGSTSRLTVEGSTHLNSSPLITSDVRLKNNIVRLENPLETISHINGYTYTLKSSSDGFAQPYVGVLAQEVLPVFPEAVRTGTDGYLSVTYDAFIPLLIESVKALREEVDELRKLRSASTTA
jgi:Chaperone of endosialidase